MEGLGKPVNWEHKRVLLTGHTGFKGGWLGLDLAARGAQVLGISLAPDTAPNLFDAACVSDFLDSRIADIRNLSVLIDIFREFRPEVVFHLAAQPLVRRSYSQPVETFETNVVGTANVLEAVRQTDSTSVVVVVTTDKCYENKEWSWGYREADRLGGHDPYSASKAAAEIVTAAYRASFFSGNDAGSGYVAIASARAGNVIGGGDWSQDRLVPDMVRAFQSGEPANIRNPLSVRPWQHVLEPIEAYLHLADRLWEDGAAYSSSWNFGPERSDAIPVSEVADTFAELWGDGAGWQTSGGPQVHESSVLRLDCSRAALELGWVPRLGIRDALRLTAEWYRRHHRGEDMTRFTLEQISNYQNLRDSAPKASFL